MKVLLVNPHTGRREPVVYPLGLAYVAGALEGHTIHGCDLQCAASPIPRLRSVLDSFRPDVVAVALRNIDSSASYDLFFYYPAFAQCIRTVGEHCPEALIVAGGAGFTLFPDRLMTELPEIDFGVLLEGEQTMPDLLRHLDDPEKVPGICWREGDDLFATSARAPVQFSASAAPDRTAFPLQDYVDRKAPIGVQAKRGCLFECVYCTYPLIEGKRMRVRRAVDVADEVQDLSERGVREVFFCDSIFNAPVGPAKALCRELTGRKLNIRWKAFFNERFVDREMLLLAKEAGCDLFIFGPDGGDLRTLQAYRKAFDVARMREAYQLCREAGMAYKCAFMMNGPGETLPTLLRMLRRIAWLRMTSRLKFSLSTMRIYPGTELQRMAVTRGVIDEDDDLFEPRFYDPFPLCLLSRPISMAERTWYRWTHR